MEFSAEIYIAIASTIIALCALGITLWQAHLSYKHNKLSVQPLLATHETHNKKDDTGYVLFELNNCGIGPAIIKNFTLLYGDQEVARNNRKQYADYLENLVADCNEKYTGSLVPGGALQVSERHPLFAFQYDLEKKNIDFVHKLNIIVEYQSIYRGKTFTYDSRKDRHFHGFEAPPISKEES
jgi:hypothetical protein